jgi:hypothetical protein
VCVCVHLNVQLIILIDIRDIFFSCPPTMLRNIYQDGKKCGVDKLKRYKICLETPKNKSRISRFFWPIFQDTRQVIHHFLVWIQPKLHLLTKIFFSELTSNSMERKCMVLVF